MSCPLLLIALMLALLVEKESILCASKASEVCKNILEEKMVLANVQYNDTRNNTPLKCGAIFFEQTNQAAKQPSSPV